MDYSISEAGCNLHTPLVQMELRWNIFTNALEKDSGFLLFLKGKRSFHWFPTAKLVDVANYVHGLSEVAQKERLARMRQTYGGLSEEDGEIFEQALRGARHLEP
jgi:hypothetical protein